MRDRPSTSLFRIGRHPPWEALDLDAHSPGANRLLDVLACAPPVYAELFVQNQSLLDDERFLEHRNDQHAVLFTNAGRLGDFPIDCHAFDTHILMLKLRTDALQCLIYNGSDAHAIGLVLALVNGSAFFDDRDASPSRVMRDHEPNAHGDVPRESCFSAEPYV
jgi:hypothetical protein